MISTVMVMPLDSGIPCRVKFSLSTGSSAKRERKLQAWGCYVKKYRYALKLIISKILQ